jgi:hypothetical protein
MSRKQRLHFVIESTFGPADIFRRLKSTCEHGKFKEYAPDFDFDWLKRRIEISASSQEGVRYIQKELLRVLEKAGGKELFLSGKMQLNEDDNRWKLPIGVLVQTPDIFISLVVSTLSEFGIKGIRLDEDGNGFLLPYGLTAMRFDLETYFEEFPLPGYLKMVNMGVVD